jgi:hypothetical protein
MYATNYLLAIIAVLIYIDVSERRGRMMVNTALGSGFVCFVVIHLAMKHLFP